MAIKNDNSTQKSNQLLIYDTAICGYFQLTFAPGSGMSSSVPIEFARQNVVCQVFKDISNFINSPLTTNGKKINIIFNGVNDIVPNYNGLLGVASGYYTNPDNFINTKGGLTYNNVEFSIKSGILKNEGYYDGFAGINFLSGYTWHTDLNTVAPTGSYDLYSIMLHEATHLLGFASLIDANGKSRLNKIHLPSEPFRYYSKYDTFLKNHQNTYNLLSATTSQPSSNYNLIFNSNLSLDVLHPNCTLIPPINNGSTNSSNCLTTLNYSGTSTTPIYTPICFEDGSSLSHFEDQCYTPPAGFPSGNDAYFVMSNAQSNLTNINKRIYRIEEKNTLCDLGYNTKSSFTFGFGTLNALTVNLGLACNSATIAGVDDGFDTNNYTLITVPGVNFPITMSTILGNDLNATSFEGLEDFYDSTAVFNNTQSFVNGSNTSIVNFKSTVTGIHTLRYVPINSSGLKGNITYIKIIVSNTTGCTNPTDSCELLNNGGFEQNYGIPTTVGQFNLVCGWEPLATNSTPDYYTDASNSFVGIPCNLLGFQNSTNNSNHAYMGLFVNDYTNSQYIETVKTKIRQKLKPFTNYLLRFKVSLAESTNKNKMKIQVLLSQYNYNKTKTNFFTPNTSDILINNTNYSNITDNWETITLSFTTGSNPNLQYLYIGGINNVIFDTNALNFVPNPNCGFADFNISNWKTCYYFLDDVSLKENYTPKIQGVSTACTTASNTITYTTTTNGGTPTWLAIGGQITSPPNQSFVTVLWYSLPGQLTLNVTNTNGCTTTVTKTIEEVCCNCLDNLTWQSMAPRYPNIYASYCINGNSCANNNINYKWHFTNGTTLTTTSNCISEFQNGGVVINDGVKVNLLDSSGNIVCTKNFGLSFSRPGSSTAEEANTTFSKGDVEKEINDSNYDMSPPIFFPNPSTGMVKIITESPIDISVVDVLGKEVYASKNNTSNSTIDLSSLQKGVYMIKAVGENVSTTEKLILK